MCLKSVIIRVSFSIHFLNKSSCIGARSSPTCPQAMEHLIPCFWQFQRVLEQYVVQLHLMIFKSSAGAGGFLVAIGCNPVAVHVQPHSSGCMSHSGSFHWFIWRNTLLLWKLDASVVGGNDFGSTWERLVATFSQYFLYRKAFKVSPFLPLQMVTRANSPALFELA